MPFTIPSTTFSISTEAYRTKVLQEKVSESEVTYAMRRIRECPGVTLGFTGKDGKVLATLQVMSAPDEKKLELLADIKTFSNGMLAHALDPDGNITQQPARFQVSDASGTYQLLAANPYLPELSVAQIAEKAASDVRDQLVGRNKPVVIVMYYDPQASANVVTFVDDQAIPGSIGRAAVDVMNRATK